MKLLKLLKVIFWIPVIPNELQERMLSGMVLALGDPYSSYLSLEQSQSLNASINGTFEGIGITFTMVDDGAIVLDVYQDTPAKKAGILSGDIITHIEEHLLQDIVLIKSKK